VGTGPGFLGQLEPEPREYVRRVRSECTGAGWSFSKRVDSGSGGCTFGMTNLSLFTPTRGQEGSVILSLSPSIHPNRLGMDGWMDGWCRCGYVG
jgi:hypothetical protein